MRVLAVAAVACLILSCREVQPFQPVSTIQGYRLDGIVTSANGIPLGGAQIYLYYNYDYYSDTPVDTVNVVVQSSTRSVDVAVYTPDHVFVRQLFLGPHAPGVLPLMFWDGLDSHGVAVSSGKYLIRYALDGVVVKYTTVVIDGHLTAVTDAAGNFTLGPSVLPVGTIFDAYYQDSTYAATFVVLPAVDILLRQASFQKAYTGISLSLNQVSTIALTLE